MMLCPLKFSRYEFEGGTECIGAECGFYGCVCTDGSPLVESLYTARQRLSETQERLWEIAAERDELTNAINELQKKQPYCYDPEAPLDTLRTAGRYIDELTAERDKWKAKAEHVDAHSKAQSKTEPKLSERPELLSDSREKLRIVMPRHNGEKYAKLMVKQFDQLINDELHDSREKLEADVSKWCLSHAYGDTGYTFIIKQLDRQAAITERECSVRHTAMRATIDRLQTTVDELYKSCDILRDKNRALKLHIGKMQEGRHGWHVKGVELQRQVDELTAQLHASNAERERLRECLGIATDNAHDLLTLVDESGNVYDRDEGLA